MATITASAVPSRLQRARQSLSPREWASLLGMGGFVLLLHVVGWGVLIGIVAPRHYQVGANQVFGVGLGLTAYVLGMRHAFDADHIAAIDYCVRGHGAARRRGLIQQPDPRAS